MTIYEIIIIFLICKFFKQSTYKGKPIKAIYGTGGAGYCITKQVMDRMTPWMG